MHIYDVFLISKHGNTVNTVPRGAYGEEPSPQPVHEAFHALLHLEQSAWLTALFECLGEDIDLTLYLIKHACRCVAGLKFVELIILYGAKRSGKDTFVSARGKVYAYFWNSRRGPMGP